MSRVSVLDRLEDAPTALGEAWAAGATRKQLAEDFGVSERTITEWIKRDDVKAAANAYLGDLATKVKRKTDNMIAARLDEQGDELTVDEILKVRKAFAGDVPRENDLSDEALVAAAMELLDDRPDLAKALQDDGVPATA